MILQLLDIMPVSFTALDTQLIYLLNIGSNQTIQQDNYNIIQFNKFTRWLLFYQMIVPLVFVYYM